MTPAHADLMQSLAALGRCTDEGRDRTAARWFVAGLAVGLLLAWAVWPSTAHAQPEPSVAVGVSTDRAFTAGSVTTINTCPHPITVTEDFVRHALPMALLCSRLRKLGVGTLLQPGETWTVIVWRKP